MTISYHPQSPPAGDRGDSAWFDKLTVKAYEL